MKDEVFEFISDIKEKKQTATGYRHKVRREIASELHCSVSAGYYTCRNLRDKGLISFLEGKNRTIIITVEE